jgi:hypothetical protein
MRKRAKVGFPDAKGGSEKPADDLPRPGNPLQLSENKPF